MDKLIIQIFGTTKCRNTQKALRFFKERQIKLHFVNLTEKGFTKGELNNISRCIPRENLIDKDGKEYSRRGLKYMSFDIEEEILSNPLLIITPIVRNKNNVTAGYAPEIWKKWLV